MAATPRPHAAEPARSSGAPRIARAAAQAALATAARGLARATLALHAEGLERLPAAGPVLLAVRHVHHLWDGVALLAVAPRPVHLLVGLDWIGTRGARIAMERATGVVGWPVIVREEGLEPAVRTAQAGPRSAFTAEEALGYLRRAHRDVLLRLAEGRPVAMFPQGFPRVDPHLTIARDEAFRAFRPGVVRFARAAQRRGIRAPVVPVGIAYAAGAAADPPQPPPGRARLGVTLRFGAPLEPPAAAGGDADAAFLRAIEARVRALSGLPPAAS